MSKKYKLFKKQSLYSILVGFLIKNGNKSIAIKVINTAFSKVSKKIGLSRRQILLKLFLKLNSFVEVRKLKVRKRIFFVPFPTTIKRRLYLTIKWLVMASQKNKKKISLSEKLAYEIEQTLTTDTSFSLEFLKSNLDLALKNRSNLHYRW
jgi:ribosomal protein S7